MNTSKSFERTDVRDEHGAYLILLHVGSRTVELWDGADLDDADIIPILDEIESGEFDAWVEHEERVFANSQPQAQPCTLCGKPMTPGQPTVGGRFSHASCQAERITWRSEHPNGELFPHQPQDTIVHPGVHILIDGTTVFTPVAIISR